jgi:hypothetical protein
MALIRTVAFSLTILRNKTQKQKNPLKMGTGLPAEAGEPAIVTTSKVPQLSLFVK